MNMKKIKRYAVLALVMCLLAAMLPTIPFVTALADENGEATLTGIEVISLPGKTEYWIGEALETDGLIVVAHYSDGSTAQIEDGFTLSDFHNTVTGRQTVTVTYKDKTAEFTVTVNAPEVTAIDIGQLPRKTEYWTGEALDTNGLTLTVLYSDTGVVEISEGFTVTGFDSSVAGEQTLTVTYMGKTATFTVTVKQPEMTGIEIIRGLDKTEYWIGETLDTTGLTLVASYSDGSEVEITEGFTVTGFQSAVAGAQTLTVTYMGASASFIVTVKQPEVIYIEVLSQPAKTVYWTGEELDTTGLVLLATYRNGTTSQITGGFTVTGFDSISAGSKTVVVFYGDTATEFTVTVNKLELTGIKVIAQPVKTQYWIGEALDTTGLVLEVAFSDGRILQTAEDFNASGFNSETAGTKPVRIYYQDYEDMFAVLNVEVKAPTASTITGVEIYTLPAKTEYFVGEKKDFSGLSLYVVYSDGSKKVVTSGWFDSGFSSTSVGIKTITVLYNLRYRTTFTVTVKERCDHTDVENGVCIQCSETMAAAVTDGSGNVIGNYVDMADALEVAASGSTLVLLSDTAAQDLHLPMGAHLDLNGFVLTVETVLTYGNSLLTDSSPGNTGVLKITDPEGNMISPNNGCLPVYDSAKGGYRFFCVTVTPKAVTGGHKYWFQVKAENFEEFYLLIRSGAQVLVQVKMTWDGQDKDVYATADVTFTKVWADRYQANEDIYITVSVTDTQGVENFKLTPGITSGGVEVFGEEME